MKPAIVYEGLAQPRPIEPKGPVVQRQFHLTPREITIAVGIWKGLTQKQIAFEQGISIGTVKQYAYRVFFKLGVTGNVECALWVERNKNLVFPIESGIPNREELSA